MRAVIGSSSLRFVLVLCLGAVPCFAAKQTELPAALTRISQEVQASLDRMDSDVQDAANLIALHGLNHDETRRILRALYEKHSYAVDTCTVDIRGTIVAVEPEQYRSVEGADISDQEQIKRLHKTRKAVLSKAFESREGIYAVDLEWPVFDREGEMVGSVSILLRPEALLKSIIAPHMKGFPMDVWVMQPDGTIIFDPDAQEVGLNVFTDPVYQPYYGLRRLAKKMGRSRTGSGVYDFSGTGLEKNVTKQTHWTTVGLHGTEWRVNLVQVISGDPDTAKREFSDLEIIQARDALRRLAKSSTLQRFLSAGQSVEVLRLLQGFYESHPDLYSVMWVTKDGITRYGYPKERSLYEYNHREGLNKDDAVLLGILEHAKEAWSTTTLAGGRDALVYLCPVGSGDSYRGMLYFVRIMPKHK
ncbi:MAG: cache domain-containing protein [Candidatus Hydrogenedentes bacterium]|nr:cache domain-containing protein [Candidatus Hydrogenedentota bacterium]